MRGIILDTLIGKKFNRLTVVGLEMGKWQMELICICICGNKRRVSHSSLKSGKTGSCGCLSREMTSQRSIKHGQCNKTSEYKSWINMKERCTNINCKDYESYGGAGITYCERWDSFINFFEDMGKKPSKQHSLDRFPNQKGNYEPNNCRWATPKEQARNVKTNVILNIDGISKCVIEWTNGDKKKAKIVYQRLKKGWTPKDAVFAPIQKTRRKGLVAY